MTADLRQSPLCLSIRAQDPGYQSLSAHDRDNSLSTKPSLKAVGPSAATNAGPALHPTMRKAMLSLMQPLKQHAAVAGLAVARQHQRSDTMPPGIHVSHIQQGCQPFVVNVLESGWQAGTGSLQQAAPQQQPTASPPAPENEVKFKTATKLRLATQQVSEMSPGNCAAAVVEPMQPSSKQVDPGSSVLWKDNDGRQTSVAQKRARQCIKSSIGDRASTQCSTGTVRCERRPAEEIKTFAPTQSLLHDSRDQRKLNLKQAGRCPRLSQDGPGSTDAVASGLHCMPRHGSRQASSRGRPSSGTPANGARWAADEKTFPAPVFPCQTSTRKGTAKGIACEQEPAPDAETPWIAPDQAMAAAHVALLWKEPAAKHNHVGNATMPVRIASFVTAKERAAPAEAWPPSEDMQFKKGTPAMPKQLQGERIGHAASPASMHAHQTSRDSRPASKQAGASASKSSPAGLSAAATHSSQGSADMQLQSPKVLHVCASHSAAKSGLQITAKPFISCKSRPAVDKLAAKRPTDVPTPGREQSHACPVGVHRKPSAPRHPLIDSQPGLGNQMAHRTAAADASHGQWRTALMSKPASSSPDAFQVNIN